MLYIGTTVIQTAKNPKQNRWSKLRVKFCLCIGFILYREASRRRFMEFFKTCETINRFIQIKCPKEKNRDLKDTTIPRSPNVFLTTNWKKLDSRIFICRWLIEIKLSYTARPRSNLLSVVLADDYRRNRAEDRIRMLQKQKVDCPERQA